MAFPLATPIVYPDTKDIASVILTNNKDTSSAIEIETDSIDDIMQYIQDAEPTRRWSVQDNPAAENYYTIKIKTATNQYDFFVYDDGLQAYIERLYVGIYKVDRQLLEFIEDTIDTNRD